MWLFSSTSSRNASVHSRPVFATACKCFSVCDLAIVQINVCKRCLRAERRGVKRVGNGGRGMQREHKKQRYQRRASKTISCVSWVICDPAFFPLQRAAVCWNTASGRVKGWRGARDGGGGESDFSNKC